MDTGLAAGRASTLFRLGVLAAALLVSPISPFLLVLIPLGLMLVALRPDDVPALLTGVALLALAFLSGGSVRGTEWFAHRSWPVLLGSGFVVASLLMGRSTLLARSLGAVGTAAVTVAVAGLLRPYVVVGIDGWMGEQIQFAAVVLLQWSHGAATSPEVAESVGTAILRWADIQRQIYPALLALASLPALAIGWYVLGRLSGRPEMPAPVREFRFSDHLVWLFAAGLALFVLAPAGLAERLGANAAVFMAALFVVRGGAVIGWLLAAAGATTWAWMLLALAALLLYPVVLGTAFVFGIGDTWLDVRERFRRRSSPGSG
jgi:hypothetical protein